MDNKKLKGRHNTQVIMGAKNGKIQTVAAKRCMTCAVELNSGDDCNVKNQCWVCLTNEIRHKLDSIRRELLAGGYIEAPETWLNSMGEYDERAVGYVRCESTLKKFNSRIDSNRKYLLDSIDHGNRKVKRLGEEKFKLFRREVDRIAYTYDDSDREIMAKQNNNVQKYLIPNLADLVIEYAQEERWNAWPANIMPDRDRPHVIVERAKSHLEFLKTAQKHVRENLIKLGINPDCISLPL